MVMGAHVAPLVRAPTLPDKRTSTNGRLLRRGRKFTRRRYTLSSYGINYAEPIKLLFLVLFLWSGVVVKGQELNAQSLIQFKSSLVNADDVLSDWQPGTAPCPGNQQPSWYGVICSQEGAVWGLQLENLNLSGEIDVNSLTPLPLLRSLSFMNNQFEGPLPEFKKIGPLKTLYLSNNKFAGPIPDDAFEGMASLKKLHLANNQFTGDIPTSISSPRLLEAKFENNQFEGRIPEFPPGLKILDLSNNKLSGPIPKSIKNMDPASFSGNKNLCGPPLDRACPTDAPAPAPATGKSPPAVGNSGKSSMSAGRIIIIVIVCLLALAAVVVLYIVYHRRNHPPRLGRTVSNSGQSTRSMEMAPPAAPRVKKSEQQQHGKLAFINEDRQRFELQDLLRASAEVLGSGSFGSSYKAVLMDGQAVVVKRFKQMSNVGREEFHEHMRRLGRLSHPNLLPPVAYYYRKEEKLLVFDYVYHGSLAGHLHGKHTAENPGLNWPIRLNIIKGVAKGMSYLYNELPSLVVPHGHLKSSNVLLDKSYQPLLMDYTLLPVVNMSQAHQLLAAYRSPEYAQQGRNTKKSDVWCLGVLILEVLTGQFLANYILNIKGDFANWINTITNAIPVLEVRSVMSSGVQVFDQDMGSTDNARGEMVKLLKIGLNCCEADLEKRLDMNEAVDKILAVKERDI